jgi:hypothetical protein
MSESPQPGQPRVLRFVPVCVRHDHGFYAGPIGYVESDWLPGPVVLDLREKESVEVTPIPQAS